MFLISCYEIYLYKRYKLYVETLKEIAAKSLAQM